jgi:glycosyltransferase involved in cell wall biosynthesis
MTDERDRFTDAEVAPSVPPSATLVAHDVGTPGGMERQFAELCTGLLARGYRVTVIARRCELAPHPALRFIRVRGPRRPFSLAYPAFFVLGSLAVLRWRDGILNTMGAIVLNRADVVTVQFCHRGYRAAGGAPQTSRANLAHRANAAAAACMTRAAERFCYHPRRARQLVAVSRGVARELERFFPAAAAGVAVIPNGVDGQEFTPQPGTRDELRTQLGIAPGDLVALFVGGDWDRKGLRFAIEGITRAAGWHLLVAGRGDEGRYRRIAEEQGVVRRVHFAGHISLPARHFAAADAFVLPTLYEAFALVTLEAAAAGLPLLVTAVNGTEELLRDGVNGWFVERDSATITQRLDELRDDSELRAAMSRAARASVERYGWDRVVESSVALYRTLASP